MINIRIQPPETKTTSLAPRITVVGVGGAGNNAVNNMIASGLDGVEFLVCNTDAQALSGARANRKIQLGTAVTGGLGAGAKPEVGRAAAEESIDEMMQYIDGANMVFITAGMGGGTGTGAAPVIARACKELGILTVGVVTKPFHFEGTMRMKSAEAGIQEMQQYVDTLIVIPNQNLFRIANEKTTFADSFKLADNVLQSAVRGVTDLMVMPGLVNLDFADIKTTMTEMGKAMMGTGEATGDRRAVLASEAAINNPLLDDVTMKGARGVIINIAGGNDMTLFEVDEACNRIREEVDPDANIIFGTSIDETLNGGLRVTVLATGIETMADKKAKAEDKSVRRAAVAASVMAAPRAYGTQSFEQARSAASVSASARSYSSSPQSVGADDVEADLQQAATYRAAGAVRAQVRGDVFIPPQPVEADAAPSHETVSYSQITAGVAIPRARVPESEYLEEYVEEQVEKVAAPQPVYHPAPVTNVGIPVGVAPLAAPVLQPQPRRAEPAAASASLFERITRRVRQTLEGTPDVAYAPQPAPQYAPVRGGAQPVVTSQPIPQHAAAQPVDVARPAKPATPQAELDLEIPAFLRRQAS